MKTKHLFSKFVTTGTRLIVFAALMFMVIGYVTSASAAAVTVELCATPGSVLMPDGANVLIWGYGTPTTPGDCSTATAGLPGPKIDVNQGDVVTVTLHNNLPGTEFTSLLFQGQSMAPDLEGIGHGGTKSYTFTASNPGTYLYEAGLLSNAEHQVAMGLYGALIVRPTNAGVPIAGQAYADVSTAYNEEAVLVLSEIDPTLNGSSNPANFDMREYHPKYWLINGKAYPNTAPIPTVAGHNVLLRYINAGLQPHSMGVLGLDQNIIAIDGSPLNYSRFSVAESIAQGRTMDTITTIPVSAVNGSMFALYEANFLQHNNNAAGFGGMLTFLTLPPASTKTNDAIGPSTSAVTLTPSKTNGSVPVVLSASVNDAQSDPIDTSNIQAAEYYIDSTAGTATAMSATNAPFDTSMEAVNATISVGTLASLSAGSHTIYVRGQDAAGNWGAFSSATLNLDKLGPATTGLSLNKNPSNGTVNVVLTATGNDSASGNSNIAAAEYSINGGSSVSMTVATPNSSISSLSATILAATINALPQGTYVVSVRSRDAANNWGNPTTINLVVDKTGPGTSLVAANPNPNNGTLGVNSSTPVVRVTATFTDALSLSKISAAEGFIDTVGANGTGFVFIATDGVFNSTPENGYSDIPLTTINTLSNGNHTIYVHGKDSSGNWGPTSFVVFTIDKLPPAVSGLTLTPPASNNTAVAVSATTNDTATGNSSINKGEYFVDTLGTAGTGTAMTVAAALPNYTLSGSIPATTISALAAGSHTVYVRARDAAGNWSTAISTTLLIDRTAPTFSGITLNPTSIPAGTASVGLTVNGASDGAGGSGVAGGEYWFGSTNITAGTGTGFSGMTATINTSALTAGSYTVRVRIRDAAGNWSVAPNSGVRTATLIVTAPIPDAIFSNTFSSASSPFGWTSASGTINVNATANLSGAGTNGMQVAGNGANYVQNNFTPSSSTYDARFYFNPRNNSTTSGQSIFVASSGTNNTSFTTPIFRVRYQVNSGTPQVQIVLANGSSSNWTTVSGNAANYIEVVYQAGNGAANSGSLQLYVNGVLTTQTLNFASSAQVTAIRLGSVVSGGNNTAEYFDAFVSKRSVSPLIGP